MGVINFAGPLPVAVTLKWKGDTVANAVTDKAKDFEYVIANESVTSFRIAGTPGGTPLVIERTAAKGQRFFDEKLNMFTTSPTSGAALDALIAAGGGGCTIDLTFSFHTFFDALLEQMTRTDADLHNVANPNDSKAILDTFIHSAGKKGISITYKSATKTLTGVPCKLVAKDVKAVPTKAPAVKLVFELDFRTGIDAARREAMRKLIAMDWSKLARFGQPDKDKTNPVQTWWKNVLHYLANHSDIDRAEKFRAAIVARHKAKDPKTLATDLRDDIDQHMITANHWGQAREDMKTERHQRLLSDLFGTLHQSAWLASPVFYLRTLEDLLALSAKKDAALALQYGTGHCGEHSTVSFTILSDIIRDPGSKVGRAVKTGNANIDHAFVVYDLLVTDVIDTITTAANNTRTDGAGVDISVWNLRDAINNTAPDIGFVMDPYLDKTVMKPTAKELLDALNRPERQKSRKDTDFLAFDDIFPTPKHFKRHDFTTKPEAERKALVKNV